MRITQREVPVERHRMQYRRTYQGNLDWEKIDFIPTYSFENDFVSYIYYPASLASEVRNEHLFGLTDNKNSERVNTTRPLTI